MGQVIDYLVDRRLYAWIEYSLEKLLGGKQLTNNAQYYEKTTRHG